MVTGMPESRRPKALPGVTQRISTGWGNVYVTVNEAAEGEPFEVFVTTGRSGGSLNTQAEAIGKLASCALRAGCDPSDVAASLEGIRSARVAADNGDTVHSIPDAVGLALRRHLMDPRDPAAAAPIRGDE